MQYRKLFFAAALAALLPTAAGGQEIGSNDFRISQVGLDGVPPVGVSSPALTYNSQRHEYLAVWRGRLSSAPDKVYVQRIDATDGREVGADDLEIGTNGNEVISTAAAYDSRRDEYLVVWTSLEPDGNEAVYGQRLDGATAQPVGTDDFQIAFGGPFSGGFANHRQPAVVYNPVGDEYLVAWASDAGVFQERGEEEIFVRRIAGPTGLPAGPAVRISAAGGYGDRTFETAEPAVAHDPNGNVYLVVWEGNDGNSREIFGQLLSGGTLAQVGVDDSRITFTTDSGGLKAVTPDVAFHPVARIFFTVFANELTASSRIEGQWVDPSNGLPVTTPPIRFDPETGRERPQRPAVAVSPSEDNALVVWKGWAPDLAASEREVFGRFFTSDGSLRDDALRLSDVGGTGDSSFLVFNTLAAWGGSHGEALTVWQGVEDTSPNLAFEVYGQRLGTRGIFADGFEAGDLSAWSTVVP